MRSLRTALVFLLAVSCAFPILIGVYMSRPWESDDSPSRYLDISSFLWLAGLLAFAGSPNVGALLLNRLFRSDDKALLTFLVGAAAIASYGIYAYSYTITHPDAQGGLTFMFVPLYQWFALTVWTIVCLAMRNLRAMRENDVDDQ